MKPTHNGKTVYLDYASEELSPLDYRDVDGRCRLCQQVAITGRHNCTALREIAAKKRLDREKMEEAARQTCSHPRPFDVVSHEEMRCRKCGEILFIPDTE